MRIIIVSLTDDPLDPPGADRYGGAQLFIFDLCRHLVRTGNVVTLLTRKSRPDKPDLQQLGPSFQVRRLRVGPDRELSHHDLWEWQQQLLRQIAEFVSTVEPFEGIFSINWLSGLMALETHITPHVHHILSLGRARKELGEENHAADIRRDQGELKVFRESTRLICACINEFSALQKLYPEIDNSKAVVIPYPVEPDAYIKRPLDPSVFLRWKAKGLEEGP
jgi:D-inositol-3-phosphate glycosyltransferase